MCAKDCCLILQHTSLSVGCLLQGNATALHVAAVGSNQPAAAKITTMLLEVSCAGSWNWSIITYRKRQRNSSLLLCAQQQSICLKEESNNAKGAPIPWKKCGTRLFTHLLV